MAIEKTLVLVKPDGVLMKHYADISARYEAAKLTILKQFFIRFTRNEAANFYTEHEGKFFFTGLVLALSSDYAKVLILEGENAIQRVRELNGATNPAEALPGTIRRDFRSAGGPFNTVHASDSPGSFLREYELVQRMYLVPGRK